MQWADCEVVKWFFFLKQVLWVGGFFSKWLYFRNGFWMFLVFLVFREVVPFCIAYQRPFQKATNAILAFSTGVEPFLTPSSLQFLAGAASSHSSAVLSHHRHGGTAR